MYRGEKIFIRQAGVGIAAAYDDTNSYCPQSVYVYKMKDEYNYISPKFLLAVLQSRIMTYYLFKKFGEIDAAQAFPKLTHERLSILPIPCGDQNDDVWRNTHDEIVQYVDAMMEGAPIGGTIDWTIERKIHALFELTGNEDVHITEQMGLTAYHKAMQQLYPSGPPPKPIRTEEIRIR